jgi:hypothetical protein
MHAVLMGMDINVPWSAVMLAFARRARETGSLSIIVFIAFIGARRGT